MFCHNPILPALPWEKPPPGNSKCSTKSSTKSLRLQICVLPRSRLERRGNSVLPSIQCRQDSIRFALHCFQFRCFYSLLFLSLAYMLISNCWRRKQQEHTRCTASAGNFSAPRLAVHVQECRECQHIGLCIGSLAKEICSCANNTPFIFAKPLQFYDPGGT